MFNLLKTAAMTSLAALTMTATFGSAAYAQSQTKFDRSHVNSRQLNTVQHNRNNSDQLLGGVLGAVVGGVIGSEVAGNNARTEGAVIGAVLGGVVGATLADNSDRSRNRTVVTNSRRQLATNSRNVSTTRARSRQAVRARTSQTRATAATRRTRR